VIVLDASAVVDVVLDQPADPWVLEQVSGQPLCAPCHLRAEVLSAVARLVRAGQLGPKTAERALDEAAELEVELVPLGKKLLRRALSMQARLRVLDGLYVAVAEERGAALVTTDLRLARAGLEVEVRTPALPGSSS
jgi:predicted nucleic acid-binding protein